MASLYNGKSRYMGASGEGAGTPPKSMRPATHMRGLRYTLFREIMVCKSVSRNVWPHVASSCM